MNERLWASDGVGRGGNDHYVTQLNPDNTTRDFVDYDSNLIAVAHAVPDASRAARVLARVDRGRCSAAQGGGPQFVSEVYYGKQDTTHGNTGDSWCAMGRIAWFDSHARKYVASRRVVLCRAAQRRAAPRLATACPAALSRADATSDQTPAAHSCAGASLAPFLCGVLHAVRQIRGQCEVAGGLRGPHPRAAEARPHRWHVDARALWLRRQAAAEPDRRLL